MTEGGRRSDARAERDRRLAEALRANLKRRRARRRSDPEAGRLNEDPGEEAGRRRPAAREDD